MNGSEVAQLREKITLNNEAAQLGLSGLASGVSRHEFIEARMDQEATRFLQLLKDGKVDQLEREVDLMQREIKRKEEDETGACHTTITQ